MIYAFEDYVLDMQCYELRRAGIPCKLEPQAFNVLAYLLAHRDRVVTKDELLEHLWPDQHVGDASLAQRLTAVRKALGDSGRAQRLIKTVHGRGYRFIAPVEEGVSDSCEHTTLSHETVVHRPARQTVDTSGWEQKPVTVLAIDLVFPYTMDATGSYDEPWTIAVRWEQLIAEKIESFGGVLLQRSSSLLTAAFGVPRTLDQMPQRAVHAALAIRHLVADTSSPPEGLSRPEVRLAVHLGTMLVHPPSHDAPVQCHAVREILALPVRLLGHAKAQELLISSQVARLMEGECVFQERQLLLEREASHPTRVYTVVCLQPGSTCSTRLEERFVNRFVGREHELDALHERLQRVEAGQGQVVGIVGDPGVGKSRLLYEFRRRLLGQRITYVEGRCLSYGKTTPYLPVLDLLRQSCDIVDTESPKAITEKVHRMLQTVGMDPREAAPYLHRLLGIHAGSEPLAGLSPQTVKLQTFAALRRMSLKAAQHRPLIIAIEDLQWIDKTTEDFFASLLESLSGVSVLFLVTYRPGYRPPWIDKSYATQIALQPLAPHDSQRLFQSLCENDQLSDAMVQTLFAKAEGNPFFLEELARTLRQHDDTASCPAVPDTIQGVLMARIDQLPDALKQLLQTASILGREVPLKLLRTLWQNPDELDAHLQELTRGEFLYQRVETEEPVYLFKHALIQEIAYMSLPLACRRPRHAAAGRAFEALYAHRLDEVIDRLAYHYARSAEADKAVMYLTCLAERAAHAYAHVEAATALQEARAHVEQLPAATRESVRLELMLRQASSLSILGRFDEILALLMLQQERVVQLEEPTLAGRYHFRLGLTHTYLGAYAQASQYAHRAIETAQRCHDTATMGMAYYVLALERYSSGRFQQGVNYGHQAVTLLESSSERHWLSLAYWVIGNNASLLGDFDVALEALGCAHAVGEAIGDPRLQCLAAGLMGSIYAVRGDFPTDIELGQRNLARSPDPVSTALAAACLGSTHLEHNNPSHAIPLLEQAVEQCRQSQLQQGQGRFAVLLGEAWLMHGDLDEAQRLVHQGLDMCTNIQYLYGIGLAQRVLGQIAQAGNALTDAARHLHDALQTFTEIQARFEVGRTHLALAELAAVQGQWDFLRANLQKGHYLFTVLRVPKYVERAAKLAKTFEVTLTTSNACAA